VQDFRPLYAALATVVKGIDPDVVVAKVDAVAETKLAERFHVKQYPSIRWFESGKEVAEFPGDLSQ
jgi:thioredoxin-like negative regulator of GroEL